MPAITDPSLPEELPVPSAELVMMRVILEAYFATTPRKRGLKQLRLIADRLTEAAEDHETVLPFRQKHDREAAMAARRQALNWFRQVLPAWMSAMSMDD